MPVCDRRPDGGYQEENRRNHQRQLPAESIAHISRNGSSDYTSDQRAGDGKSEERIRCCFRQVPGKDEVMVECANRPGDNAVSYPNSRPPSVATSVSATI